MDEYYCPQCGAILEEQWGFAPSLKIWTCTSCGQLLTDEDFDDTVWFCDECGAVLNTQDGFTEYNGNWVCSKCGYETYLTEESVEEYDVLRYCPSCGDMLNNQYEYNRHGLQWTCSSCGNNLKRDSWQEDFVIDGYVCPNCKELLDTQIDFEPYENYWQCTECGVCLHHEDSRSAYTIANAEEIFKCPKCHAILNVQYGFDMYDEKWQCTRCDAELYHEYSYEPYVERSIQKEYDSDDFVTPKTESNIHSVQYKKEYAYTQPKSENKEKKISKKELRKKRIKAFFFNRMKIQIGYDCEDLLRKDINNVSRLLSNQAFTNIKTIPIKDVYVNSKYRIGEVEQIIIDGKSFFEASDMVSYDAQIIITFHQKKEIEIPFALRSLLKYDYIEAGNKLQDLGFTEIYEKPIYDLRKGWLKKDGSVEKISIAGNEKVKKGMIYKYDVEIIIEYHTFKYKEAQGLR